MQPHTSSMDGREPSSHAGRDEASETQEKIRALTQEVSRLRAKVETLEGFTRSAAHDLVAPLRQIRAFAARAHAAPSPEVSARALSIVMDVADRASGLVRRLLEFSEAGCRPVRHARVNLDAVVRSIQDELTLEAQGREILWSVGPLPEAEGDEGLLRIALLQLLTNALKYTRHRKPAVIKVSGHAPAPDEVVISVTDNGVGFDATLADRLFTPFHRLHPASAFEGHGIGLATVRQIAARHGGRAWAEGHAGVGATFYLSLRSLQNREEAT